MTPAAQFQNTSVYCLPLYRDNYAWLICQGTYAWIIDPGQTKPVVELAQKLGVELQGMLVTHRHWDHVNGIEGLLELFDIPVYGATASHDAINQPLREGDTIQLGELTFDTWQTPGHTADHLSYFNAQAQWLFCGDTLFSGGCGRLKETGNIQELFNSTQRIGQLSDDGLIFCSHEYTLDNLTFASAVEPSNAAIPRFQQAIREKRADNLPSIPSTIHQEKLTNPFLRCHTQAIQDTIRLQFPQKNHETTFDFFESLRGWKDNF